MRVLSRLVLAFASAFLFMTNMAQSSARAAEVKAFVTGAARPMYDILAPQFERLTGHKLVPMSGPPPELVAQGEVALVVSGLPPLLGKPNVEWLGLIPPEINSFVVFTGGLGTASKEPEAGRALLRFLATPEAMAVYKSKGLDPVP